MILDPHFYRANISWSWVVAPSSKRITEFQVYHNPHHSLLFYTEPALVIYIICLIPEGICECSPWFWCFDIYVLSATGSTRTKPEEVTEENTDEGGLINFLFHFSLNKTKQNKQRQQNRIGRNGKSGQNLVTEASSRAHPFHRVIHWHQSLEPFAMQDVCEFHVDGQHGARVLQNPVFIHVRCIVVTRSSENIQKGVLLYIFLAS